MNKAGQPAAESVEQRAEAEGNMSIAVVAAVSLMLSTPGARLGRSQDVGGRFSQAPPPAPA